MHTDADIDRDDFDGEDIDGEDVDHEMDALVRGAVGFSDEAVHSWDLDEAENDLCRRIMATSESAAPRPARRLLLVAAAAVLVGGVAGGVALLPHGDDQSGLLMQAPSAAEDTLPREPETPPISPLAALRLTDAENRMVWETWQLGMAQCMRKAGFDVVDVDYDVVSTTASLPSDEAAIRQHGYHAAPQPSELTMPENDRRARDDPSFRAALLGSGDNSNGGCRGTALRRTHGTDNDAYNTTSQILAEARAEIGTETTVSDTATQAAARWAACMSTRGFSFESPSDPLNTYAAAPDVTTLEVHTRLADVACQRSTGYVAIVAKELARREQDWIEENSATVHTYLEAKTQYLTAVTAYRDELLREN